MITKPGKFESQPDHAPYMWELVIDGGIGEDRFIDDVLYTYVQVQPEDVGLFPDLVVGDWWRLWEDDQGFVHAELTPGLPKEEP